MDIGPPGTAFRIGDARTRELRRWAKLGRPDYRANALSMSALSRPNAHLLAAKRAATVAPRVEQDEDKFEDFGTIFVVRRQQRHGGGEGQAEEWNDEEDDRK